MLATPGSLPEGPEWLFEVRWDGLRVLVDVVEGILRITAAGKDVTALFPELSGIVDVAPDLLLDGEIVLLESGVPSYAALADRLDGPAGGRPVTLMVFDVLRLYGVSLVARPLVERRATLERLSTGEVAAVALSPTYTDGEALLAAAADRGIGGVVAKRRDGLYLPGQRSPDWVTVARGETLTCVVGGWRPRRSGGSTIGTLLVGVPDGRGLRYAGRVPFASDTVGAVLAGMLTAAGSSPFSGRIPPVEVAGVRWCQPRVVVDVTHGGWSTAGTLRRPVFRRIRPDLTPGQVELGS